MSKNYIVEHQKLSSTDSENELSQKEIDFLKECLNTSSEEVDKLFINGELVETLDEIVHEFKVKEASDINNNGLRAQIMFLEKVINLKHCTP